MKSYLILTLALFTYNARAATCGSPLSAWSSCSSDSDCVLIDDPCGELHADPAVNKKYKDVSQKFAYCGIAEKECAPAQGVKKATGVQCKKKMCTALRK
ncbi:MAG: hypothetical protein ACXVAX_04810 [Pseudobdellovibrio sp.]